MLWQKLYIACVLETNSEKLKALVHETENAIILRLQTLGTPIQEHREIAPRPSLSACPEKRKMLNYPGQPDCRNPPLDQAGSENLRELLPANVQSCAEYERLFDKYLDALTRWTRLRGFEDYPRSMGTLVESEVCRAERNYSAAFSALHQHTRCGCPVCEGGLGVHVNADPGATIYRSRELALCEHRKSSRDLPGRLSATPIKTDAMAPQAVMPEHRPMSFRMAKLVKEVASWNCSIDRWWSTVFTEAKDWTILSKMALAGIVLITIALRISPLVPWPQIVRVPVGFSGILLIDVSLGLGAFLLLYDGNPISPGQVPTLVPPFSLVDGQRLKRLAHQQVGSRWSVALHWCSYCGATSHR